MNRLIIGSVSGGQPCIRPAGIREPLLRRCGVWLSRFLGRHPRTAMERAIAAGVTRHSRQHAEEHMSTNMVFAIDMDRADGQPTGFETRNARSTLAKLW